jgi:hypothetical protein
MREDVAEQASTIVLPKFVVEVPQNEQWNKAAPIVR